MSEIKGQLLGVVLVVLLFGVIAAVMQNTFNSLSDSIYDEVEVITGYDTRP